MDTSTSNIHKEMAKTPRLPYLIALAGVVITLLSWLALDRIDFTAHFLDSHQLSLSWVILIAGFIISFLLAMTARLILMKTEHEHLLNKLNQEFKKEISDRIHAEETKQKLEKALLQGQKLQAIGTLAGGIAHDFNNILYAIIGYVDMACEDTPKDSTLHHNLCKVIEAAQRGQDLIARILAFSRRHHHTFNLIPLKETIEGVLALLKPTIPASVTIDFNITPSEEHSVVANETQLHQVIVNIINNAVDAMDSEGTVTISLSMVGANDEILEQFPNRTQQSYCRIDISDTGHGMDQGTMTRIFEPFFTTKEVGKGTGLGLATVHAIIEEHQGEIIVNSQLGHGTTFTILLPEYSDNKEK